MLDLAKKDVAAANIVVSQQVRQGLIGALIARERGLKLPKYCEKMQVMISRYKAWGEFVRCIYGK